MDLIIEAELAEAVRKENLLMKQQIKYG